MTISGDGRAESDLLRAALDYAARGWAVFPCHWPSGAGCSCGDSACSSPAKHPITAHGLTDATMDPDVIRQWWDLNPTANIGCAMGAVSGIAAVDVDGLDAEDYLYAVAEDAVMTTRVHGTPRGGCHYVFAYPGVRVKTMASVWLEGARVLGLDWRGDGGYILLPPSVGFTTKRSAGNGALSSTLGPAEDGSGTRDQAETAAYTVKHDITPVPWPLTLPPIPERPKPKAPTTSNEAPRGAAYALGALRREVEEVRSAPEGRRNDTLNVAAFNLARFVVSGDLAGREVADTLVGAAVEAGLPEEEARRTIASGFRGVA